MNPSHALIAACQGLHLSTTWPRTILATVLIHTGMVISLPTIMRLATVIRPAIHVSLGIPTSLATLMSLATPISHERIVRKALIARVIRSFLWLVLVDEVCESFSPPADTPWTRRKSSIVMKTRMKATIGAARKSLPSPANLDLDYERDMIGYLMSEGKQP